MCKIVVVGSLNMDLVLQIDRMPRMGETIHGKNFAGIPGGKGANQAVAAARLGASVSMIGCVGKDPFGFELVDNLKKNDVDTKQIKILEDSTTGLAMIFVKEADNCIILNSGANYEMTPEYVERLESVIAQADVFVTQLEIPLSTVKAALSIAKRHSLTTILNPAPAQKLEDSIYENVDIIVPNESETELLTGIAVDNEVNIERAMRFFHEKGILNCIITMGARGVVWSGEKGMTCYPAYEVKAVDSTAAGDSFIGALALQMAQKRPLAESIHFCNAVGALTVTKKGAQISLPTINEVTAFLAQM